MTQRQASEQEVVGDKEHQHQPQGWLMATGATRRAARPNVGRAVAAAKRKRTIARVPKSTRTAPAKQANPVKRRKAAARAS